MNTPRFQSVAPIRAETVAKKLSAIRNMEFPDLHEQLTNEPRLAELLWFVQYLSMQPGGLAKFCANFLEGNRAKVGTKTMQAVSPKNDRYTIEQTLEILRESQLDRSDFGSFELRECLRKNLDAVEILEVIAQPDWDDPDDSSRRSEARSNQKARIDAELGGITRDQLCNACLKAAAIDLPHTLAGMCSAERGFEGAWYFPDLISALFAAMQAHRDNVAKTIAMTEVAKRVFDTLDYARAESGMVEIIGDSRFGKTQALKTWCAMQPGVARLVAVPCSNSEADLYKSIGAALGITYGIAPDTHLLKDRIEYVVRYGGLMLVFDEAHFLWPVKYSKTTAPARLNWIRTELVDKGIPVALCYTPQAWDHVRTTFLRTTKYATEQFSGRRLLQNVLPKELSKADLMAVARIHFPDLDVDFLDYIVESARTTEGYIATMEAIAKRVRFKAQSKGGKIAFSDIETATIEVAPELGTPSAHAPAETNNERSKRRSKPVLKSDSDGINNARNRASVVPIEPMASERFSASDIQAAVA